MPKPIRYSLTHQTERWKIQVAGQCNRLLDHAAELEKLAGNSARLGRDIRSLVGRVAEFEELAAE